MRAFFCIPIDKDVASSIGRIAARVRDATDARASWVRTENYHVTLQFVGEIDPMLTVELDRAARRIASHIEPFPLELDRLGAFPSAGRARVLWLGAEAPPAFLGLVASLRHELTQLGFRPDRQPPVAHVTLARIKGAPDANLPRILDEARPETAPRVRADRIALLESTLTPSGAVYAPLFAARFREPVDDGR